MSQTYNTANHKWNVVHVAAFIVLFFVLQTSYQNCRGTIIEHILVVEMTVRPSSKLISWITPGEHVVAQGHNLISKYVQLSILNGCEGTEAVLMLTAATLVFTRGHRRKLFSIIAGSLLIFTVNQARIVALYYCLRFNRSLFDVLHGYIAPLLVIGVAGLFFMLSMSNTQVTRAP